jgi:predicted metalloprotease with PDZ domain
VDFIRIREGVYGDSFQDFFHTYVETSADITLDLIETLEQAGLQFRQDELKGWTLDKL